ncbi:helix-turn-helix transcriptional regulator [Salmonella enterica subsp. enterica serovar Saintpaul]|nr:helix-turn-helix transcriptional regulator [Salmonella enterica subsp. enterica serovar Saintpaul]
MLCGLMHPASDAIKLLFALMPHMLLVHAGAESHARLRLILELLNVECHAHKSPCDISVSRLTDLLLLYVIETAVKEKDIDLNIVRAAKEPELASLFLAIMDTPEDDWTLQKMSDKTGLSRSTFIRRLSSACKGYTSNEILSRLRMSLAAAMMTDGVKAVEAGKKVGYQSASGFSKAVKKLRNAG